MRFYILLVLACLLTSCAMFRRRKMLETELSRRNEDRMEQIQQEANARVLREQVLARFDDIRSLISAKKFTEAENMLSQMRTLTEYEEQMNDLQELIDLARNLSMSKTDIAIDQKTILNESQNGLQLPKNYNRTKTVPFDEANEPPLFLEELLDRSISLKVKDMSLADFALQLRDLEGINIADPVNVIFNDEILKGNAFTANFKDVPL
ncbi:MAG: hypothetical protein IJS15_06235, partial [Victivallales bacterium]|nr:hypothetical protein [Victivallales bacterium]